jgi:hypothetical protein
VVRARDVEWRHGEVVVVSLDRLLAVLARLERGTDQEPLGRRHMVRAGGGAGRGTRMVWSATRSDVAWRTADVADGSRNERRRTAPAGHREPVRPRDDNPHIKLDGPARRLSATTS